MPSLKVSVFISSTSDLKDERQALKEMIKSLGAVYDPFLYEDEPARGESPEEYCKRMIHNSDIFIGIVGGKYGSLYPPDHAGSIVEFEFDEALSRAGLSLTAVLIKDLSPEQVEERQRVFRERIGQFNRTEGDGHKGGVWRRTYQTLQQLTAEVQTSITTWLGEVLLQVKQGEQPTTESLHKRMKIIGSVIAIIATIIFLLFLLPLMLGFFILSTFYTALAIAILAFALILCITFTLFSL